MKAAELALHKALQARSKAFKRWDDKIDKLRKALKNCTHPITTEFQWEHDSGYGVQTKHKGLICDLCLKKNRWPNVGSQNWDHDSYENFDS